MSWNRKTTVIVSTVSAALIAVLGWFWYKKDKQSTDAFGNETGKENHINSGSTEGSKTNRAESLVEPNWNDPLRINYMGEVIQWVAPKKVLKIKDNYADQLAQEIYKAKGRYILSNDDEAAVKNVFSKKVKDKVQVSNITQAFFKRYKKDLKQYLQSFLSESELQTYVHQPIAQLNKYREV